MEIDFLKDLNNSYYSNTNKTFKSFFRSPNITKFIIPNQFTSIFFTNTGLFRLFLFKIQVTDTDRCECGQIQTAIHLLSSCPSTQLIIFLKFGSPDLVTFVKSKVNYLTFCKLTKEIYRNVIVPNIQQIHNIQ